MNKKLLEAEDDLLKLLKLKGGFLEPIRAIKLMKYLDHEEAEVRAAFWTLRTSGKIEHEKGRLVLV